MSARWTEEDIAAYADGELPTARTREIQQAIDEAPAARKLVDEIGQLNTLLRQAYEPVLQSPVPASLQAAVLGEAGKVVAMSGRRRRNRLVGMALAASFVLGLGLAVSLHLSQQASGPHELASSDSDIAEQRSFVLETLPSGKVSKDGTSLILTFQDRNGRYCRQFETTPNRGGASETGIACRTGPGRWQMEALVKAPASLNDTTEFVPAEGRIDDDLDRVLDSLGAQPPLQASEEEDLLRNSWQPVR